MKMKCNLILVVSLFLLLIISVILCNCSSPASEPQLKEVPWTGEGVPPPPAPGTKWVVETTPESATSPPQTKEPAGKVNETSLPSRQTPVSFDDIRSAMDTIDDYAMTIVLSQTRDEYTLTLVVSNDGLEINLAVTDSPFQSKLGSQYRLLLLGQEAYIQPKSSTALREAFLNSGLLELDVLVRIDLRENWSVFGVGGSRLSWHVPIAFTQIRAETHRPLLFDPIIPSDFFNVSILGEESRDGWQLTDILVQTDWLVVFQWLIDSGNLTRAWEGPNDDWSSEVELWVDENNLVRQMKIGQKDRFAAIWEVWIHEPFGAASIGYSPQFPAQDVIINFIYDEVPEVIPPESGVVVLMKDML